MCTQCKREKRRKESAVCLDLPDLCLKVEGVFQRWVDEHYSEQAGEPQSGQQAEEAKAGQHEKVQQLHRDGGQSPRQEAHRHPQAVFEFLCGGILKKGRLQPEIKAAHRQADGAEQQRARGAAASRA